MNAYRRSGPTGEVPVAPNSRLRRIILAAVACTFVAACGSDASVQAAVSTVSCAEAPAPPILTIKDLPAGLTGRTFVELPLSDQARLPALDLYSISRPAVTSRVGVFSYSLDNARIGDVPSHTSDRILVEGVKASRIGRAGPSGIEGVVVSRRGSDSVSVLLTRGLSDRAVKATLNLMSRTADWSDGPIGQFSGVRLLSHLGDTHVPGISTLPLSYERRGWLRSFTDDSGPVQRALAIGAVASCDDVDNLKVYRWWYGPLSRSVDLDGILRVEISIGPQNNVGAQHLLIWNESDGLIVLGSFGMSRNDLINAARAIGLE